MCTGPKVRKISFMSCLPKHELSDTCLVEDRAEFNEMCRKILPYPTCMKSEFLSSGG